MAYRCAGRIEHGADFCSRPGIHRELIDEPLLRHPLDRYVPYDSASPTGPTRLSPMRRTIADREAEVSQLECAIDATERAWDAGISTPASSRSGRLV